MRGAIMPQTRAVFETTEAAIFTRLWEAELTPAARLVLKLKFGSEDVARMHELARRNKAGELTADEERELDNYISVGDRLGILQSKARKLLKTVPPRPGLRRRQPTASGRA